MTNSVEIQLDSKDNAVPNFGQSFFFTNDKHLSASYSISIPLEKVIM